MKNLIGQTVVVRKNDLDITEGTKAKITHTEKGLSELFYMVSYGERNLLLRRNEFTLEITTNQEQLNRTI